ncbi:hypothetical protein BGZ60DRAFT_397998 [Tricladium varicosporioides]|nr:hypothetical protein BGZ60DRAFT_397998 [Hymenoscyphus varicosporioides]
MILVGVDFGTTLFELRIIEHFRCRKSLDLMHGVDVRLLHDFSPLLATFSRSEFS